MLAYKHRSSPHSRQSSKHLRNMKPKKRKSDCPWTSTWKRKKQRKTIESTSEDKKTTLAQSDKGSWFDQVKWLEEEESNASVSARKLLLWNRLKRPYREKKQHCSWYKFAEWSDGEVTWVQILPLPSVLRGTRRAQQPMCEIGLCLHKCELKSHSADWLELIRFKWGVELTSQAWNSR